MTGAQLRNIVSLLPPATPKSRASKLFGLTPVILGIGIDSRLSG